MWVWLGTSLLRAGSTPRRVSRLIVRISLVRIRFGAFRFFCRRVVVLFFLSRRVLLRRIVCGLRSVVLRRRCLVHFWVGLVFRLRSRCRMRVASRCVVRLVMGVMLVLFI
jgi:hypothetical protein